MTAVVRVIPGCPHAALAETRLRHALAAAGHPEVPVRLDVIDPARGLGEQLTGSPTFLLDDRDLFDAMPGRGAACRLYPGADGLAGVPDLNTLTAAVARALEEVPR